MTRPTLTVEIAWTKGARDSVQHSSWTDITGYVRDGPNVKRGRATELDPQQAASGTMTLDNRDGRFDPVNTNGAYYPNVKPMRQMRFKLGGVVQFTGYIENWEIEGNSPYDSVCVATIVDGLTVINNSAVEHSETLWSGTLSNTFPVNLIAGAQFRHFRGMGRLKFDVSGPDDPSTSQDNLTDFSYTYTTETGTTASGSTTAYNGSPLVMVLNMLDVSTITMALRVAPLGPVAVAITVLAPRIAVSRTYDGIYMALQAMRWPDSPQPIGAVAGRNIQIFDMEGGALATIQRLIDSEQGYLYISTNGIVTIAPHAFNTTFRAPSAVFARDALPFQSARAEYTERYIINDASLQRVDGLPQVRQNSTSQTAYGLHIYNKSDLLNTGDADLATDANELINKYRDPDIRISGIEIDGEARGCDWNVLINAELGNIYHIGMIQPYGTLNQLSRLESIEWKLAPQNYKVTWGVSPAPKATAIWQLDHPTRSKLGRTTILG